MGDRLSAERACKDPNPIIDGRKANVNLAILGAKPRGNITQGKVMCQWRKRAFSQLCNLVASSFLKLLQVMTDISITESVETLQTS